MPTYEVWLADDAGNRLENLNQLSKLEYVIAPSQAGYFSLALPYDADLLAMDYEKLDRQIHIFRAPDNGSLALEAVYFVNKWKFSTSGGETIATLSGAGLNSLLQRRIVAYYAASAQASMGSIPADDMMKRIVDDALGSDSNTDYDGLPITGRDIESLGFSIQSESSAGTNVSRAFSWRTVHDVLTDIQGQTKASGAEVFFDIVPTGTSPLTCEFRTYTGQWGSDRTLAGANALRFGTEWGNVDNPVLTVDYGSLQNFVYIGGKGQESDRAIEEVGDVASIALSQFGRREGFAANTSTDTADALQATGETRLNIQSLRTTLAGELLDSTQSPYGGSGWKAGDKITVPYIGRQFDAIIRKVRVIVDANGQKVIGSVEI